MKDFNGKVAEKEFSFPQLRGQQIFNADPIEPPENEEIARLVERFAKATAENSEINKQYLFELNKNDKLVSLLNEDDHNDYFKWQVWCHKNHLSTEAISSALISEAKRLRLPIPSSQMPQNTNLTEQWIAVCKSSFELDFDLQTQVQTAIGLSNYDQTSFPFGAFGYICCKVLVENGTQQRGNGVSLFEARRNLCLTFVSLLSARPHLCEKNITYLAFLLRTTYHETVEKKERMELDKIMFQFKDEIRLSDQLFKELMTYVHERSRNGIAPILPASLRPPQTQLQMQTMTATMAMQPASQQHFATAQPQLFHPSPFSQLAVNATQQHINQQMNKIPLSSSSMPPQLMPMPMMQSSSSAIAMPSPPPPLPPLPPPLHPPHAFSSLPPSSSHSYYPSPSPSSSSSSSSSSSIAANSIISSPPSSSAIPSSSMKSDSSIPLTSCISATVDYLAGIRHSTSPITASSSSSPSPSSSSSQPSSFSPFSISPSTSPLASSSSYHHTLSLPHPTLVPAGWIAEYISSHSNAPRPVKIPQEELPVSILLPSLDECLADEKLVEEVEELMG